MKSRNQHCSGFVPRRQFMQVGFAAGLGLSLPELLKQEAKGAAKYFPTREGVAKSIIHIYLPGGMAHQESWDPKPYAPAEYRGPFKAINTSVDGLQFGEKMVEMAKVANKITVIHSMTHREAAHERGTHNMFTGYTPSPALKYPSFGSVISHELGSRNNLPPYVCVPSAPNEFAGTGYLSSSYGPFSLGADPAAAGFSVKDLNLPNGVDDKRFERRRSMLEAVDSHFRTLEKSDSIDAMDSFYQSAYGLISSQKAREAFDMTKEEDALKDKYGKNSAGLRMLMARRLVESGVRLVSLTYGGWDHHNNIQAAFGNTAGPELDKALAALITDLDERGMLDETLVMVSSEFGRTPKINKTDGRDHWPSVFSTVLAGGGVKRGYVYGASDSLAAVPDSDPMNVMDFATTVYNQLGITAQKELIAPGPRPIEIVAEGKVIDDILAKKA